MEGVSVSREDVHFINGGVTLAGTLTKPASEGRHLALIALHAAQEGERDFALYQHLADVLPRAGVAVLCFDRRGSGRSGGDFANADLGDLTGDVLAGVAMLSRRDDIEARRIGAWGVSQGGWIAPLAATRSDIIKALVIVSGAGVSPARQMVYSARYALRHAGFPDAVIDRAFEIKRLEDAYYRGNLERHIVQAEINRVRREPWFPLIYVDDVLPEDVANTKWALEMDYDPYPTMAKLRVPTLLLYAEDDAYVPVEESIQQWRKATATDRSVSVVSVPNSDHYMMVGATTEGGRDAHVSDVYAQYMMRWLTHHL